MKDLQQQYDEKAKMLERQRQKTKAMEENLKKIGARIKENDRKARTKRLIELGAQIESISGSPEAAASAAKMISVIKNVLGRDLTERDPELLFDFLQKQENNGQFFTNAMSK